MCNLAAMRSGIAILQVSDPPPLPKIGKSSDARRAPRSDASDRCQNDHPLSLRNTAPAGPVIAILARRPFRPTNRMVTRTPSTSTTLVSPSAYQSMEMLVGGSASECLTGECIGRSVQRSSIIGPHLRHLHHLRPGALGRVQFHAERCRCSSGLRRKSRGNVASPPSCDANGSRRSREMTRATQMTQLRCMRALARVDIPSPRVQSRSARHRNLRRLARAPGSRP